MRVTDDGKLIVVARDAGRVRKGIELQQSRSLRTDTVLRDHIARKGSATEGIDNGIREDSAAFSCVGHESGLDRVDGVAGPLIIEEKIRPMLEEMRNLERTTQRQQSSHSVISRLGRVLAGKRKRPGV